jgi:predicted transcriptional regulator|tara:strand:- start:379 stop:621 length:243 start_codon:yes stop_codon:yes gene_type:complete
MTKNNSVQQMVEVLEIYGPLTENQIHTTAFGYDRNTTYHSNKKYADMLRRGLKKGIIKRCEIKDIDKPNYHGNIKFLYYV